MKKVLLLVAVASAFMFVGCKKTCNCTSTQQFPDEPAYVTHTTLTIEKGKCSDMNSEQTTTIDGETISQKVECVQE